MCGHGVLSVAVKPDYTAARRHLMKADPKLGAIIKRVGPCELHSVAPHDPFETLCHVDRVAAAVDQGRRHDLPAASATCSRPIADRPLSV